MSNDSSPIEVTEAVYPIINSLCYGLEITCAEVIGELISSYVEIYNKE